MPVWVALDFGLRTPEGAEVYDWKTGEERPQEDRLQMLCYALYLEVWTHHVTADEEPALLEPALGGPDTTTRARTVWQVRAARLEHGEMCSDLQAPEWLAREPREKLACGGEP